MDLSPITLEILATAKLIFAATIIVLFIMIVKRIRQPLYYAGVLAISLTAFVLVILTPQTTMFWGNNGDELYIAANMTQMVSGDSSDFYYAHLPPFYPPLYFWTVGFLAKPFATNGLAAYKVGVALSALLLFLGTFFWLKLHDRKSRNQLVHPWMYFLIPLSFLTLLPFDEFILKPHEALSALLSVLLVGAIGVQFQKDRWKLKHLFFYGISGAIILMSYYFWGVLIAATLAFLVFLPPHRFHNVMHLIFLGIFVLAFSSPYLVPLYQSIQIHGIDLAQGTYFSIHDILTFTPWAEFSLRGVLSLVGLIGLILARKKRFFSSVLILFAISYLYQFFGLFQFVKDATPLLPSKPFLYLVRACLAVGLGHVLLQAFYYLSFRYGRSAQISAGVVGVVILGSLSPLIDMIDRPGIIEQMNENTLVPKEFILAESIREHAPDYADRTWLAPTRPEINTYLPLKYYISHNEHYSHFAAGFSDRLDTLTSIISTSTPQAFFEATQKLDPPVDALLLFYDETTDSYPLNFWIDNYPNGGTSHRIDLDPTLITDEYWIKTYDEWDWRIFTSSSTLAF